MKVVILAGGLGTRLSELTKVTPKPMVRIGKYPILIHILKHYSNYGFKINITFQKKFKCVEDKEIYKNLITFSDSFL